MQNIVATPLSRRTFLGALGTTTALTVLPGCVTTPAVGSGPQAAQALLDDIAWNLLQHEPTRATSLGVDTGEHAALRSQLGGASPEAKAAKTATLRADLERARAFDKTGLDPATRTSFEVVESAYATALQGMELPYGDIPVGSWRTAPYVVIQNVGAYIDLPRFLDSDHPIADEYDAEAYVSRLEEMPGVLMGELERITAARQMGVVPPDFLLDKAIEQMTAQIADARSGGALVESLVSRTQEEGIAGNWDARAREIVTGQIAPALEAQLAELQAERAVADSDPGMWSQPHGEEWYDWSLRSSTTTDMSPDEIHELGLETLEDIHARMDPILRSIGYTEGSVGERMTALSEDERFKFAEGDPGRAEIMSFIEDRIAWIRAQMPRAFRELASGNLEVRRLPPAEEPGAPTAYGGAGSVDGTVPGKMWINLRTTDLHRKYDVPTLVHHETIPGHVWEGEYSNQLPLIRSILAFNAFSEGWALYSEQLADELGAYDENPAWRLGYLQDAAFRACRLVVDTGLHHKRWSREQAVRFFMERNGNKREQVASEVDRYCSWPGQATGYMVGKLEILRQRERAMAQLGGTYDLRDFNQALVDGGNAPLDVLAANVSRYIESAA
ncbi:DUF885 domain-containing protein [Aurantiacibacter poecillastricola]|uniref:DUF885 domain-containing protein n=1 Tax=Aurantiacibacter poecillastricola TaxID=3064385 RepID=UPI00273FEE4C|nr:DUF885 domain-containing protein [Aurantiacibacter sp. 219JJ12-13]MDP5262550.1 DUF885 domain-containing protein [Aurantiacibacter sp. 219JJ12-13]